MLIFQILFQFEKKFKIAEFCKISQLINKIIKFKLVIEINNNL